jgi:hypothetical protein
VTQALQENVGVTLAYAPETTFGTQGAGPGKRISRVTSSLVLGKASFTSNTVRSDQEISDARHGMKRVTGQVAGEIMMQMWDDWLEALLRGTWTPGTIISETIGSGVSIAADQTLSKFTLGGGDPLAIGLKTGDIFALTNVAAGLMGINYRITGFGGASNRDITVTPPPITVAADTTFTLTVAGKKLTTGIVKRSFSIEQVMPSQDVSEMFLGCRISQGSFRLPPDGMATVTFDVMGQGSNTLIGATSPGYPAATPEPNTAIMAGLNGALLINGVEVGNVTGLDFTFNNNMSQTPVLGTDVSPDVFHGLKTINGNISAFIQDEVLLQTFQNETEISIVAILEAAGGGTAPAFISFGFERVKLMGITRQIGADGGVIGQFPFQSLLKTGGTGTVFDQSSMVIQRSNLT